MRTGWEDWKALIPILTSMEIYTSLCHRGLESLSLWKDKRMKDHPEFRHSQNPSECHQGTWVTDMADRKHHDATNLTVLQPPPLTARHSDLGAATVPCTALRKDPAEFPFTQILWYLRILEYGKCKVSLTPVALEPLHVQRLEVRWRLQMAAEGIDSSRTEIVASEGLLYTVSWSTLKTMVYNDKNSS